MHKDLYLLCVLHAQNVVLVHRFDQGMSDFVLANGEYGMAVYGIEVHRVVGLRPVQ